MKVTHKLNLQYNRNVSKIPQDYKRKETVGCTQVGIRQDSEETIFGWVLKMRRSIADEDVNEGEALDRYQ